MSHPAKNDYTYLRQFLKAGDWQTADQETTELILTPIGKDRWIDIDRDDLLHFPKAEWQAIDALWVEYSQGKFGFSVQQQIYLDCGAQLDGNYPGDDIWHTFCDRVGWRVNHTTIRYAEVIFQPSAPPGQLPIGSYEGGWGKWGWWIEFLWRSGWWALLAQRIS